MKTKRIGIIGGIGPFAGLDLFKKIFNVSNASTDQEHLDVLLHSFPAQVPDRTEFLTGVGKVNPAIGLFDVVKTLAASSVDIIGIPCNTSHADEIWAPLTEKILTEFPHITMVNMVEEVSAKIKLDKVENSRVGIMATSGTVASAVYDDSLIANGLTPVYPDDDIQLSCIQDAIYNKEYGIKAFSDPTTQSAYEQLKAGMDNLISKDVGAIILGCTELPLVITDDVYKGVPLYDSTLVLASKLVTLVDPKKLKK